MALQRVERQAQFLEGTSTDTLHRNASGAVELTPDNLIENASMAEQGTDGEPVGFDLSWNIPRIIAYHNNVTRPGSPRRRDLARQTTSGVPPEENAWVWEEPWIAGIKDSPTSGIVPATPTLEHVASTNKGFEGGTHGWAWGVSTAWGPTTLTSIRYFILANGETPLFPVPDMVRLPGVRTWDIYMVRVNKGSTTLRLQRRVPVEEIRSGEVKVNGPWRNRGKPPQNNQSGIGTPPQPSNRDIRQVNSGYNCPVGVWRAAVQIEQDGGTTELSQWGPGERVRPSTEKVTVQGPAPENQQALPLSASVDPREVRPSGKHPDEEYMGQELDWQESLVVQGINAARAERGLPVLVLSAALNRAAENGTTPGQEGYEGATERAQAVGTPGRASGHLIDVAGALGASWDALGVARHPDPDGGWRFTAYFGDVDDNPVPEEVYCEKFVVEHVEDDGTVYARELAVPQALQSWSLVQNGKMGWRYSGSFGDAVRHGANVWDNLGPIDFPSGGSQCAVMDGSLGGPMGRTHSDGRMYFDSAIMRRSTQNARYACSAHEFGHAVKQAHTSAPSVLRTPIITNGSNNYASLTSYDRNSFKDAWGSGGGGDGSGGGSGGGDGGGTYRFGDDDPPGGHGSEMRRPDKSGEDEKKEEETHTEWRQLAYRKNTSLRLRKPRLLKRKRGRGLRYTYWLRHDRPNGSTAIYRVIKPGNRQGAGAYFDVGHMDVACELFEETEFSGEDTGGQSALKKKQLKDKRRKVPPFAITSDTQPEDDTTKLEPPDPSMLPDEPIRSGQEVPPAGRYLATITGLLEDGGVTRQSEPGLNPAGNPYLDITAQQMLKLNLPSSLNLLRNAEFARVNSAGQLEDWTAAMGVATNTFSVTEGVLTIDASVTTATSPSFVGALIPYDATATPVLTVGGTLGLSRWVAGSARVSLRQLTENGARVTDAQGANLGDLMAGNVTGTVAELPFVASFGAKGQALDPSTAYVQMVVHVPGVSVNATAYFKNLRILGIPSDVRYVESGEDGVTFDTGADVPLPGQSFVAVGSAPEADLIEPAEPVAPLHLLDFESAVLPAGWSIGGSGPSRAVVIDPAGTSAAIHGKGSFRVVDASNTANHSGWVERTDTARQGRTNAFRALYKFEQLPTRRDPGGGVNFHYTGSSHGNNRQVCHLRSGKQGGLEVAVYFSTGVTNKGWRYYPLGVSTAQNAILDVETIVVPGANGSITVSVGVNGQRRVVRVLGVDLRDRTGNRWVAGATGATSSTFVYQLRVDQVVVTANGDVLDREKPARPPGYTPPPVDRPAAAVGYRTFDHKGDKIGQLYALVAAGAAPGRKPAVIPFLEDAVPVRPLRSYTVSAFTRAISFDPAYDVAASGLKANRPAFVAGTAPLNYYATDTGEISFKGELAWDAWTPLPDDWPAVRAWIGTEDGSRDEFLGGRIPLGARPVLNLPADWHPTGREDDHMVLSVPEGYDRVRLDLALTDGVYVLQEPLFSLGALPLFTDRDAKRLGRRAAAGSGRWVFDLKPDGYDFGLWPGVFVSEVGAKIAEALDAQDAAVGTRSVTFATSQDEETWLPYEGVDDQPLRYIAVDVSLAGDGFVGPRADSIYARTWSPVGVVLRPDGTHFPGVAYVGNLITPAPYSDVEVRRVGGRLVLVPQSDVLERIEDQPIKIYASTEAARREIIYLSSIGPLILEVPGVGGTRAGQSMRVVFGERLKPEPENIKPEIVDGERVLHSVATADYAEVLEAAPQQEPMREVDLSGTLELVASPEVPA